MNSSDIAVHITQSEGYLGLGLDAWETLEDLPSDDKVNPRVVELRLEILCHEKSWEKADILGESLLRHTQTSALVGLSLARAKAQLGKEQEAKAALKQAFTFNSELRLTVVTKI